MTRVLIGMGLLAISASTCFAQDAPKFKVGDIVEAQSYLYYPPWHKARVVSVHAECPGYRVEFIGADAGDHGKPCVSADQIRAIGAEPPASAASKPAGRPSPSPVTNGTYKVGDRVDVFAPGSQDKATRGTIIEAGARYKVHYDGCGAHFDAVVSAGDLHPAAAIAADAADIKFLFGAWKMFTPSYPNTVVQGNTVYREYGVGAKAPPLRINADGTYVWYDEFNQPPVTGRWTTDAKIDGARYGTAVTNGVIIKNSQGSLWKVYRWTPAGDNADRVTARTMCSGQTMIGTRIR